MRLILKFNACVVGAFVISGLLTKSVECLLFSQFTLFQVVFAVSWPIPCKNPLRKIFFNIGFQFNYMEPFRLSSFYNATYFQNPFNNRDFKSNEMDPELRMQGQGNYFETSTLRAPNDIPNSNNETTRTPKRINLRSSEQRYPFEYTNHNNELIGTDLTAAQLYESIEEHLFNGGYHQNCLLKSICELARHPLHQDEEEHLLVEVITFLLTPSQHNGFSPHETYEQQKYEAAEKIGEHGGDCDQIYSECENSFLDQMSYLSPAKAFM